MKCKTLIWLIAALSFVLLPLLVALGGDPPPLTINIPAHVYHIVDGDTLDVETTIRFRIRVLDTWTPESRTRNKEQKKLGLAAKDNLTKTALGKNVTIVLPLTSKSGRVDGVQSLSRWLCEVWINGEKRGADIQFQGGFSGRTKAEQQKLFPKDKNGIDP